MSTGRRSIFDIKCKDETGSIYVVEMQNRPEDAYLNRVQCYAAHTYASQVQKGHMHSTLMPVIMLSITNKILFNDTEVDCINYHWNVESKTGKRYLMALSYVFIELPKFTKKATELDSKEDEWLYFFSNWNKTKAPPQTVHDPLVLAAYKTIERFNWSEEEYDTYFRARLAAEAEEITLTKSFQEGLQEGENIKATKTVLKMAKMGIDLKLISEATELTFEEVETIIRNEK